MKEPKLTLLVKSFIMVDGFPHWPGEILHLPERQALAMVGEGVVEQIPDEGASTTGSAKKS